MELALHLAAFMYSLWSLALCRAASQRLAAKRTEAARRYGPAASAPRGGDKPSISLFTPGISSARPESFDLVRKEALLLHEDQLWRAAPDFSTTSRGLWDLLVEEVWYRRPFDYFLIAVLSIVSLLLSLNHFDYAPKLSDLQQVTGSITEINCRAGRGASDCVATIEAAQHTVRILYYTEEKGFQVPGLRYPVVQSSINSGDTVTVWVQPASTQSPLNAWQIRRGNDILLSFESAYASHENARQASLVFLFVPALMLAWKYFFRERTPTRGHLGSHRLRRKRRR